VSYKVNQAYSYDNFSISAADAGSVYEPHPQIGLEYDTEIRSTHRFSSHPSAYHSPTLSPMIYTFSNASQPSHPFGGSPYSRTSPRPSSPPTSTTTKHVQIPAEELWVYYGPYGTCTFWRAMVQIPLAEHEMPVTYCVNGGQAMQFFVPGCGQELRWAAHSVCILCFAIANLLVF